MASPVDQSDRFCYSCRFPVVCSLAFIHGIKRDALGDSSQSSESPSSATNEVHSAEQFMTSIARQNLSILTKALQRMEHYWAGIAYVSDILEKHTAGKYEGSYFNHLHPTNVDLQASDFRATLTPKQ